MTLKDPRVGSSVGFHTYPTVSNEATLGDPETIIWSSIRQLCSRGVAEGVAARTYGISRKRDREGVARNLKLYIQQAAEFYEAARAAKPNTAPLIYYYAFLNLAKGCCELRQPQFHEHNECYRHGISWRPSPRYLVNLEKEEVSITTRGVWHVLWEFLTQARCSATNPTRIKIKELFLYCPEISSEVERTFMAERHMLDLVGPDILYDDGSMEAWIRFSVHREGLRFFRLPASSLIRQIETPRSGYTEVRSTKRDLRTFESTTPAKVDPEESILGSLRGNILGLNVFNYLGHEKTIEYAIPVQTNLPIRMPQMMVLYTILF